VFGIRVDRWKVVFLEQLHEGIDVWRLGFEKLRAPKIFDLLADPFERGDTSMLYEPVVRTPRLLAIWGQRYSRGVAPELQEFSAETEARELQS
ncbi:MAG TPA: hypothetical protein VFO40_22235, partial [Chthoniobacterales bacterium]|nr:hypothetical protein [Chthoniobacterales bacterium]